MEALKKVKIEVSYDPATPLLEKTKTNLKSACTLMFIKALFLTVKKQKQSTII